MARLRLLVLTALLLCAPVASARTATEGYTGISGPLGLTDGLACAGGLGGACFPVAPGETRMNVTIRDATGLPVGALWKALDANGYQVGTSSGFFCGRANNQVIPRGAATIVVDLAPTGSCLFAGTSGTIQVTFR